MSRNRFQCGSRGFHARVGRGGTTVAAGGCSSITPRVFSRVAMRPGKKHKTERATLSASSLIARVVDADLDELLDRVLQLPPDWQPLVLHEALVAGAQVLEAPFASRVLDFGLLPPGAVARIKAVVLTHTEGEQRPPLPLHVVLTGFDEDRCAELRSAVESRLHGHVDQELLPTLTTYVVSADAQPTAKFLLGCVCATVVNESWLSDCVARGAVIEPLQEPLFSARYQEWHGCDSSALLGPELWLRAGRPQFFAKCLVFNDCPVMDVSVDTALCAVELMGGTVVHSAVVASVFVVDDLTSPRAAEHRRERRTVLTPKSILRAVATCTRPEMAPR